jgi:NhaA family Na+:H+ antiporter
MMTQKPETFDTHWTSTSLGYILGPMQVFIHRTQSSSIVLIIATIIALIIANSPLNTSYIDVLNTHIGITIGSFVLEESVLQWVNDGLMAIFFFLVGLEIKREVRVGELASLRAATLPILAAVGGVTIPALIYFALNVGSSGAHGWGVPMATDIAFALGCLALLGNRVPFGLTIFLTAVAIVDDIIAVLVIALFYSSGLNPVILAAGFAILLLLAFGNVFGIRNPLFYATLGVLVWLAFLYGGIHATLAGILVALTVPAQRRIDAPTFLEQARRILHHFEMSGDEKPHVGSTEAEQVSVIKLEELCKQVETPLHKMEYTLHGWVAFLIIPLFALANAGVVVSLDRLDSGALPVLLGIVLGLTIGKPVGIVGASWLAVRIGIAELPQGVTWRHMIGVGIIAGMGFTMSLFIASLAFVDPDRLAIAKLAILLASLLAGVVGFLVLRLGSRVGQHSSR